MIDFKLLIYKDELVCGDKESKLLEDISKDGRFTLLGKRYLMADMEETVFWDSAKKMRRDLTIIRARSENQANDNYDKFR